MLQTFLFMVMCIRHMVKDHSHNFVLLLLLLLFVFVCFHGLFIFVCFCGLFVFDLFVCLGGFWGGMFGRVGGGFRWVFLLKV